MCCRTAASCARADQSWLSSSRPMAMPTTDNRTRLRELVMAAELKLVRTAAEEALVARFPAAKTLLPGNATVLKMREAAFDLIAKRGLPHRRVEEWKYTDLRGLMREAAPLAEKPTPTDVAAAFNSATAFSGVEALRIGFVNGHLARDMSDFAALPVGVEDLP